MNTRKIAVPPHVDLKAIDGTPFEIVARYLKFFSKRLHGKLTEGLATFCFSKKLSVPFADTIKTTDNNSKPAHKCCRKLL